MPGINKSLDYYKALYAIATEVDSAAEAENELAVLVKSTAEALGAKGASVLMLTEDQTKLVHMASYGLSESYVGKGLLEIDSVIKEALKGKPIIVACATTDPEVQYREEAQKEGIVSMVSLPLMIKGKIAGLLRVYADKPIDFSDSDIAFLSSVANLGATSISKGRVFTDMEKRYEKLLKERAEELSKITEAKDKLIQSVSVIAHDLKSPLAAIQSYFSVMLAGYAGELTDKQRQMIERSSVRIDGLLGLISDLLDISRIEMGQIAQEMEDISLGEVIATPLDDVKSQFEDKCITLTADISAELPLVYGSPVRLKQVFNNLLSNACKFVPDGGAVTVKAIRENGAILCKVADTGIGIPEEDLPRIFDDFYRAGNVEEITGTGLGLSIVKRIVEAHGGRIWVTSPCPETGCGSEFAFTLQTTTAVPEGNRGQKAVSPAC